MGGYGGGVGVRLGMGRYRALVLRLRTDSVVELVEGMTFFQVIGRARRERKLSEDSKQIE